MEGKEKNGTVNLETVHEVSMVLADALQTYVDKQKENGGVGFMEIRIGVLNALDCISQYQRAVVVEKKEDGDPPLTM